MFNGPLDYAKQKDYVDSMINPFMPGLYEQCLPIMSKLMEQFWLEWTGNSMASYREFSNSAFANNLYKYHFYKTFVNGWKTGYFSLGQVIHFESLLEDDLTDIFDELFNEAARHYPKEVALQMATLIEVVQKIGIDSGKKTQMD